MYILLLYVIYLFSAGNSLFLWEPRTLKCLSGQCELSKSADQTGFVSADCSNGEDFDENLKTKFGLTNKTKIIECDIQCDGAERDSVISKQPTDYRHCNRFFTYNSRHNPQTGKWYIWRSGTCATAQNITMTVHCAFAINGNR